MTPFKLSRSFAAGQILLYGLFCMVLLVSCAPENGKEGDMTGEPQGKTVTVSPDRTTMFRNPFSGWMIYSGLGNGISENFWERYDNFPSSKGTVNVPRDYAPILLIRVIWAEANPQEGVYAWQDGCDTPQARRFKMLVKGARERNMRLAFNFGADSRDKHDNACPEYVREKGCKVFESQTGSSKVWTPYPDDPVFQEIGRAHV